MGQVSNGLEGGGHGEGWREEPAEGLVHGEVGVGELDGVPRGGEEGGGGEGVEEGGEFLLFFFLLLIGDGWAAAAATAAVVDAIVMLLLSGREGEEEEAFIRPQGRSEGKLAFSWQDDAALPSRAKEIGGQTLNSFVAVRGGETEGLYFPGFVEEALVQERRGRGGDVGWWREGGGGRRGEEAPRCRARCRGGSGGGDARRLESQRGWRPGGWWGSVWEDEVEAAAAGLVL
jgi:hypothetical protein